MRSVARRPGRRLRRAGGWVLFGALAAVGSAVAFFWGRAAPEAPSPAAVALPAAPLPALSEAAADGEEAWRRFPGRVGERLIYSVSWEGIPVGDVVMEVVEKVRHVPSWVGKDPATLPRVEGYAPEHPFHYPPDFGRPVYRVRVTTRSSAWLDAFYKVDDRIESLIDAEGTFPWRYDEFIREGRRKKDNLVEFDQKNHVAYYHRRKGEETAYTFQYAVGPIADRVQDALSVTSYARLLDLSPGLRLTITVHADKRDWPTEIEVVGEERLETAAGLFDCWVLRPRYDYEGLFIRSSEPRLWVEKRARIPVKMDVKIAIGSVKVYLKEWHEGKGE